jgi:hypothetical protein
MRIADCGLRIADCGEWRVESGEWRVENEVKEGWIVFGFSVAGVVVRG